MTIGQQIRALRLAKGIGLNELARRCGVSKGHLSWIELDEQNPTIKTVNKIVAELGASLALVPAERGASRRALKHLKGEP